MTTALEDNSQQQEKFLLHHTMSRWPYRRLVNPHEKKVDVESKTWLRTFPAPIEANSQWEDTIENSHCGVWPLSNLFRFPYS